MSEAAIYTLVYKVLFWIGAGVCSALSAWIIVATIVEVARSKSKILDRDVITGVLLHGGMALAAIKLASLAIHRI